MVPLFVCSPETTHKLIQIALCDHKIALGSEKICRKVEIIYENLFVSLLVPSARNKKKLTFLIAISLCAQPNVMQQITLYGISIPQTMTFRLLNNSLKNFDINRHILLTIIKRKELTWLTFSDYIRCNF